MNRTLLLGLDGATFTILDPLMARGLMPALRGLVARSARADLMYFRDYLTALLDHTRAAVKAGQTKEQFTATTPTLTGFEAFGAHTARTLGILFDEITEK